MNTRQREESANHRSAERLAAWRMACRAALYIMIGLLGAAAMICWTIIECAGRMARSGG